tara:strand:- start:1038 stop:2534 length:1497 start_codon:yes stop_codon:yes gene_type:complete
MRIFLAIIIFSRLIFSQDALLIGVADYKVDPLKNTINDIKLIKKSFSQKGWNVTTVENPNSSEARSKIKNFIRKSSRNDGPLLIYFSGHGFQLYGENYLMPILNKSDYKDVEKLLKNTLSITELSYLSKDVRNPKIFIIDACRNAPFGDETLSPSAGLNSQFATPNTLLAYAAGPGEYALDSTEGSLNNSPYASSLAKSILISESLDEAFNKTRLNTMKLTDGEQVPWESSSLFEVVFLGKSDIQSSEVNIPEKEETYVSYNTMRNNVISVEAAYDFLIDIVSSSEDERFFRWIFSNNDEYTVDFSKFVNIDREDIIATLNYEKEGFLNSQNAIRKKIRNDGLKYALHSLATYFQNGEINPVCRDSYGLDFECSDFDRKFHFNPDFELSYKFSKQAADNALQYDNLAYHYANGWIVSKDLVKAYDLLINEGSIGGEYYWSDINQIVQNELNNLGEDLSVDGAFGPQSCQALQKYLGYTRCEEVVTRNQIEMLNSYKKK